MLNGDLALTPLAPLLLDLAGQDLTGCLTLTEPGGEKAQLFMKRGLVYAINAPGTRPQLGAKLISSGALAPEALAEALEAQRTELHGWRLGELLVHLGYVDQPVVEAFVKEQLHEALWDLLAWTDGKWAFRNGGRTREDVAPAVAVRDLLEVLRARGFTWRDISTVVHGPDVVPVLSAQGVGDAQTTLDSDAWSMLCRIDGARSVRELAEDNGYTLFEAGRIVVTLVRAGLVDVREGVEAPVVDDGYDVSERGDADEVAHAAEGDDLARLAELAQQVSEGVAAAGSDLPTQRTGDLDLAELNRAALVSRPLRRSQASFAAAITKVSTALSDVLGPATEVEEQDPYGQDLRAKRARARGPVERDAEAARRDRLRAAAAAELAAAQALAEALRTQQVEAAQRAVEDSGPAEPVEAERAEAERLAAEAAERGEAERLEAEAAERAEAERMEAERLAAEVAERAEAERVEAERVEAERIEAERIEAERIEAERLAAEAARLEAEQLEAARIAAEGQARAEAERAEAERVEAERLEAERVEAERVEAERLAAEQAASAEAERLDAEAAAQAEVERLEAEQTASDAGSDDWLDDEAQRRRIEETAAATALLVELSREGDVAEPTPTRARSGAVQQEEAAAEPTDSVAPDDSTTDSHDDDDTADDESELPEPVAVGAAGYGADAADTAALLRELSSLGHDDVPSSSGDGTTTVQRAARPSQPSRDSKKRKRGLFGL